MLQAQPKCRGADGEDAEQDQAIYATHAALQGIWYDSEAITVPEDSTDRVEESDAGENGPKQEWRRDEAIERPEQHEDDQDTAQRSAKGYSPLERRAQCCAKQVSDAASRDDQAIEHGRDMLLLHNCQDDKHAGCYHEGDVAGNQDDRAQNLLRPQPCQSLLHFSEQVATFCTPFVLHGRAYGEQ